jgi:hypothetical protein
MKESEENKSKKAPTSLFILSIICIIYFAVSFIINVLLIIGGKAIDFIQTIPVIDNIIIESLHGGTFFYILKIIFCSFAIFSVFLITKMLRKGYFLFIISQACILILPFIFLPSLSYDYLIMKFILSLVFAVFFILLFSIFLPRMK